MKTKSRRAGWQRLGKPCGGLWTCEGCNWAVQHCGHPTALWPYYAISNDGQTTVIHSCGYAFQKLADAQETAEKLGRGEVVAVPFHHGYFRAVAVKGAVAS